MKRGPVGTEGRGLPPVFRPGRGRPAAGAEVTGANAGANVGAGAKEVCTAGRGGVGRTLVFTRTVLKVPVAASNTSWGARSLPPRVRDPSSREGRLVAGEVLTGGKVAGALVVGGGGGGGGLVVGAGVVLGMKGVVGLG